MLSRGMRVLGGQEGVVEVELPDRRSVGPRRPLGVHGRRRREPEERGAGGPRMGEGHRPRHGHRSPVERGQAHGRVVHDATRDHLGHIGIHAERGGAAGEGGELPGELGLPGEAGGRRVDPDPMDLHARRMLVGQDAPGDAVVERLVVVVADQLVELPARLHPVDRPGLRAGPRQVRVEGGHRAGGHAKGRDRPDHQLVAEAGELVGGEERRPAEVRHVGQERSRDRIDEGPELVGVPQGLGEDHVRAGLPVELCSRDRLVESFLLHGIRPGDDPEVTRRPRGPGDLPRHLVRRDQALVREMPALLGHHLVLELDGRRPRVLQLPHEAHHVEHLAVSRVAVDQDGQP